MGNVENFFGQIKEMSKNTYYGIATPEGGKSYPTRSEIRHCLYGTPYSAINPSPGIPHLPLPSFSRIAMDKFEYMHKNTSGKYIELS